VLGTEETSGTATFTGGITITDAAAFTAASGGTATFSGVVSGPGAATLEKTGAGTVTLSGSSANTFTGTTTVSAGVLKLDKTATNTVAIAGNLVVSTGATLLVSKSEQVANTSDVTLSGGTILRGAGVNETFDRLDLTLASALDFGTGAAGVLTFGTYQSNAEPTFVLGLNNFTPGNQFIFNSSFGFTDVNFGTYFSFGGSGFVDYSFNKTGSTFTITAIPEPSTYVAAAGLLALLAWPMRRRLVRDAKSILGLRAPMRDRLAKRA
jgi:autotransporter-associated beta strand protein